MAQKTLIILQNPKTGYTYYTHRNRKGEKGNTKLSLKKFDPNIRGYAEFIEQKGKPKAKKEDKPTKQTPKSKK
jgi:ribosomal protein L33